jgi:hypothetical protein
MRLPSPAGDHAVARLVPMLRIARNSPDQNMLFIRNTSAFRIPSENPHRAGVIFKKTRCF